MSDNIIEITQTSDYTISIDTSLVQNDNNVIIELSNPNTVDIITGFPPLSLSDLPEGYPLDSTTGNLSVTRITGLTGESGIYYNSGVIGLSGIPYELIPVHNITSGSGISVINNNGIFNISVTGSFGLTSEEVDDRVNDLLNPGTYINIKYNDISNSLTISATGLQPSGNYSIVGHTHTSADITNFNSAVSGLLPPSNFTSLTGVSGITISNSGTNYTVSLTDPTIQLADITDLSSDSRTFLLTPSSSNLSSLITDETGSGVLVFNNSPVFSGVPTVPTAPSGTNNSQIANTSFVRTEISNLINSAPNTLDTLNELASALGNDPNFATTITNSLASKASLNGAIFTGQVVIPSGTGNFNTLTVNGTGVSIVGHTHTTNDITNFNSSVSGLLPTINNSGNNRVLTSTGSSFGIDAESYLTFNNNTLTIGSINNSNASIINIYNNNQDDDIAGLRVLNTNNIEKLLIASQGDEKSNYIHNNEYDFYILAGTESIYLKNRQNDPDVSGVYIQTSNNLFINNIPVSVSGHNHLSSDITNFNSSVSGLLPVKNVTGSGYVNVSSSSGIYNIAVTGLQPSGNYANSVHSHGNITDSGTIGSVSGLLVITENNGILTTTSGISSNYITNFNSSVSGLLPTINNSGDNRLLTSTGSSVGIDAENNLTFDGSILTIDGAARVGESNNDQNVLIGFDLVGNDLGIAVGDGSDYIAVQIPSDGSFRYGGNNINPAIVISSGLDVGIKTFNPIYTLDVNGSGNFTSGLYVNSIPVSVSGHTHNSSQITDFNTSVSGLLPVKNIIGGTGISVSSLSGIYTIDSTGSGVLSDQSKALITTVFNKTGSPIPKMTAVYINGGQGDLPTVSLAIATSDMTSAGTYGLTYETINNMSSGKVIVFGALTGLNTDQFNPTAPQGNVNGSVLYLSPTVSGSLTLSKPSAPNHIVAIGTIVRTHQNEGVIEVRIQNGFELEELHNVAISGASDGQFLQYNSGSGLWVPSSSGNFSTLQVNGTGVSVSGHTHTSSSITDFNSSVSGLLPITNILGGSNITISQSGTNFTVAVTGSLGLTTEEVDDRVSNLLLAGSGVVLNYNDNANTLTISTSGLQPSGNYSLVGHTHTSSEITDFNSSVSGLLPTISNSGDNRILTSTGSSVGINAESNLTFDGTNLSAPYVLVTNSSGDEGGEIQLAKPITNTTLSGAVAIDIYQNKLRFFEQGGSARGFYLDITSGGSSASTNLAGGGVSSSSTTVYEFTRTSKPDSATGSNGSYTWSLPTGAKLIEILAVGGGGGGGSGRRGAAGTARFGGGGASSGAVAYFCVDATKINTSLTITVGAAGTGGASVTTDDTNGNAGTNGGASSVSYNGLTNAARGFSGYGGGGGTTTTGTGGSGTSVDSRTFSSSNGGSSSATANGGGSFPGVGNVPLGGAAGGGISTGNVAYNGGSTVGNNAAFIGSMVASSVPQISGGAASTTANASDGASATGYGAGGCGGGASVNGFNSGAGGNGGPGYVRITVFF